MLHPFHIISIELFFQISQLKNITVFASPVNLLKNTYDVLQFNHRSAEAFSALKYPLKRFPKITVKKLDKNDLKNFVTNCLIKEKITYKLHKSLKKKKSCINLIRNSGHR